MQHRAAAEGGSSSSFSSSPVASDSQQWWWHGLVEAFGQIREEITGSVVYVDGPAAEILRWTFGGLHFFFEYGATLIHLLPEASLQDDQSHAGGEANRGTTTSTRVLFFLTNYLPECREQVKRVLQGQPFSECIVYTALAEQDHSHYPELGGGLFKYVTVLYYNSSACSSASASSFLVSHVFKIYSSYKAMMKDWMRQHQQASLSPVVAIVPFPLYVSPFFNNCFFLPACHDAFPLLPKLAACADPSLQHKSTANLDTALRRLSQTLTKTLETWVVEEEIYALGATSTILAKHMQQHKTQSSYGGTRPKVALLLVDRTLDFVSPLLHSSNIMDLMQHYLPKSGDYSSDVLFDMVSFLSPAPPKRQTYPKDYSLEAGIAMGSLAQGKPNSPERSVLETLATKPVKESLNALRQQLIDGGLQEGLPINISKVSLGSMNASRLQTLLKTYQDSPVAYFRHSALMQYSVAVLQTLKRPPDNWEELVGLEKVLVHTSCDLQQKSLLNQLAEFANKRRYSASTLLRLCLMSYSLVGARGFSEEDERAFEDALMDLLLDTPLQQQNEEEWFWLMLGEAGQMLQQHYEQQHRAQIREEGDVADTEEDAKYFRMQLKFQLNDTIANLLHFFRYISRLRANFKDYGSLVEGTSACIYKSLLGQVLEDALSPTKTLTDLDKQNASSMEFFSGAALRGLGRLGGLMGSSKGKTGGRRPSDAPIILLFVVGGITCSELEVLSRVAASSPSHQVLVGSTAMWHPSDSSMHRSIAERC
ncbi:Sec1 domain-containing protein 2 [Balamuthia mandrillaris]